MKTPNRNTRKLLRIAHLFSAVLLRTYIYSPWFDNSIFRLFTLYIVFPFGFVLTGLWMWQMPRISQWMRKKN